MKLFQKERLLTDKYIDEGIIMSTLKPIPIITPIRKHYTTDTDPCSIATDPYRTGRNLSTTAAPMLQAPMTVLPPIYSLS
jgi:hypothetical protein